MADLPANVEATTPTTTTTSSGPGWRFWYTIAIIVLTAITLQHDMVGMLYAIPINWLIYFLPTWLVVKLVRSFRK